MAGGACVLFGLLFVARVRNNLHRSMRAEPAIACEMSGKVHWQTRQEGSERRRRLVIYGLLMGGVCLARFCFAQMTGLCSGDRTITGGAS